MIAALHAQKKTGRPFIIGICGGSASGKTRLSNRLLKELQSPSVKVLAMDSFYREFTEEERLLVNEGKFNFDAPQAFDFDLLLKVLKAVQNKEETKVPAYCFKKHARIESTESLPKLDILIFEGILAFHDPRVSDLLDAKIFVSASDLVRYERRLARDVRERGRDEEGVKEQYHRFVQPAYERFIKPCENLADIVVPSDNNNDVALNVIVTFLKAKLANLQL